ncbi:MAG: UDP-N-acetylglucosamine--N-acetylmuramyl-(pentapeptide) pyrophosphoryl-undecaprenol N-acetylglucosamine transferase [Thermoanaerobaculum sp.]|nr:UDP-N-acetylglucosamine--N-acetylmuramyl-(pentapeptide) pyrophosphoryl-undecaprenol N-acetylglucosamine transferase [Thermoanaerobaculum sp.]MDW7968281.1 UDP-N-acetylglucosamine--N-acetylmuramyl-(pentapeptide) pyrophosphoryl-undecaprenol N-acetylglucosamine transferase [Thermoanaerobaculum sp.]
MRVLVTGGGTGGHFYPGWVVAQALREAGWQVFWLGSTNGIEATKLPSSGIPHRLLRVTGAVGARPLAALVSLLRLVPALAVARGVVGRFRPQVVCSVGGYASFPGAAAAAAAAVPLVIQEQNAWPGLTHRLLAPWAAAIACGFPQALRAFPSLPASWTGNPIRREFFLLPPAPARRALLVLGGSQGSQFLNRVVPKALSLLPPGQRPQVVHQSGERWEQEVRQRYQELQVEARVVGFLPEPWQVLKEVPLVVARAGALSVCELAASGRAALLIPFAHAAGGHQLVNAQALAGTGSALVVEEAQATPTAVAALLQELLQDPSALAAKGALAKTLAVPDATERVVRLVSRVAAQAEVRG